MFYLTLAFGCSGKHTPLLRIYDSKNGGQKEFHWMRRLSLCYGTSFLIVQDVIAWREWFPSGFKLSRLGH